MFFISYYFCLKFKSKLDNERARRIPFENPEPSEDEARAIEQFESLIRELHIEANYFVATQVELEHWVLGDPFEDGKLDLTRMKSYFVLKPIKVLEE